MGRLNNFKKVSSVADVIIFHY